MLPRLCRDNTPRNFAGIGSWIGRAHFHPGFEVRNLLCRKLFVFRWHLQIRVGVTHRLDEQTFLWITGNDRRASVAALQHVRARIELQPALQLLRRGAVPLVAILRRSEEHTSELQSRFGISY